MQTSTSFLKAETGAVTVDWVVLTAALVGLGLAAMSVVSSGVEDISNDVETELRTTSIKTSFDQWTTARWTAQDFCDATDAAAAQSGTIFGYLSCSDVLNFSINAMDDTALANRAGQSEANIASRQSDIASLNALDRGTMTSADVAAITGGTAQNLDDDLAMFGITLETYVDSVTANKEYEVAFERELQRVANDRNLEF